MQYLLMIYDDEAIAHRMSEAQQGELMGRYNEFSRKLAETGAMRGGEALHPTAAATTVRVRNGRTTTTDGPFAETKEQLGGYYVIDVPDLDAALKCAAMIPGAETGSVEVRPIVKFD